MHITVMYKIVYNFDLPYLQEPSPVHKEKPPAAEEKVVSREENIHAVVNCCYNLLSFLNTSCVSLSRLSFQIDVMEF